MTGCKQIVICIEIVDLFVRQSHLFHAFVDTVQDSCLICIEIMNGPVSWVYVIYTPTYTDLVAFLCGQCTWGSFVSIVRTNDCTREQNG